MDRVLKLYSKELPLFLFQVMLTHHNCTSLSSPFYPSTLFAFCISVGSELTEPWFFKKINKCSPHDFWKFHCTYTLYLQTTSRKGTFNTICLIISCINYLWAFPECQYWKGGQYHWGGKDNSRVATGPPAAAAAKDQGISSWTAAYKGDSTGTSPAQRSDSVTALICSSSSSSCAKLRRQELPPWY